MERTPVKALCPANHQWDAEHVLQADGHTRVVVPLHCPQCARAAMKTLPRTVVLNPYA
jgi:hypothetical protein